MITRITKFLNYVCNAAVYGMLFIIILSVLNFFCGIQSAAIRIPLLSIFCLFSTSLVPELSLTNVQLNEYHRTGSEFFMGFLIMVTVLVASILDAFDPHFIQTRTGIRLDFPATTAVFIASMAFALFHSCSMLRDFRRDEERRNAPSSRSIL